MTFIPTGTDYSQFHPTGFHHLQSKQVQFRADAVVLVMGVNGKQLYFASFS